MGMLLALRHTVAGARIPPGRGVDHGRVLCARGQQGSLSVSCACALVGRVGEATNEVGRVAGAYLRECAAKRD